MIRMEQIKGLDAIPTTNLVGGYQILRKHELLEKIQDKNKAEGMKVYCLDNHELYTLVQQKDGSLDFQAESDLEATDDDIRTLFKTEDYES